MPDFWQFPTVSMGLGPLMAIYQARFNRYLEDRGWWRRAGAASGLLRRRRDGRAGVARRARASRARPARQPHLRHQLQPAAPRRPGARQRQDHPGARAVFRGAGWNVIKVIWGTAGIRCSRPTPTACSSSAWRKRSTATTRSTRSSPAPTSASTSSAPTRLQRLVENLTDEELQKLRRGGHDPEKVYAAYRAATEHEGSPTVILAKTIKGYGMGEAGEGKNITHSAEEDQRGRAAAVPRRFGIPISDDEVGEAPFYRPPEDSPEVVYLRERREALGGPLPARVAGGAARERRSRMSSRSSSRAGGREASTTMAFVRMLAKLLRDKGIGQARRADRARRGPHVRHGIAVPQVGIYSHLGQRYDPVDRETCCSTTRRRPTGRFSRRASPRPARWPR
jgi:pyruvate dehydrogenase E1 component